RHLAAGSDLFGNQLGNYIKFPNRPVRIGDAPDVPVANERLASAKLRSIRRAALRKPERLAASTRTPDKHESAASPLSHVGEGVHHPVGADVPVKVSWRSAIVPAIRPRQSKITRVRRSQIAIRFLCCARRVIDR